MKYILFAIFLFLSTSVFSHGYILDSRAKLCAEGANRNCGPVIYEPQSVEGPDRFPETGPADGTIAAAGSSNWGALNAQTPTRWKKVDMLPGSNTFDWQLTANHRTRDWRYFITKQNWNPGQPLTRAAFDLTPFCSFQGNGNPPFQFSHTCNVPVRTGYQVILGVWDVGDTNKSFYSVIDVQMPDDGTPPTVSERKDVGDINPSSDLKAGDMVRIRLFTATGELTDQAIEMTIESNDQGNKNTWPKLFAEFLNAQNTGLVAGIKDAQGNIVPVFGKNDVFVDVSSAVTRTEIEVVLAELVTSLDIGLQQTAFSTGEPMHLQLDATSYPAMSITAELFFQGAKIGFQEAALSNNAQLEIVIADPQAGSYELIVIGKTEGQQEVVQQSLTVTVSDPADLVYPENMGNYRVDDLVVGQDGNTYRCLVAGWCNRSRTYYAPGTGLAWSRAWALVSEGPAPEVGADFSYPDGRGQYGSGTVVQGTNGNLYRCNIPGWCNSGSAFYYAPGTGLAWSSAWSAL